ncbi:MAG: NAD(P)/FAD-dependent oxidoreductase [Acidobacteriota bacterium]
MHPSPAPDDPTPGAHSAAPGPGLRGTPETCEVDYDVVVIGGAFTGSSLATLLRRWNPDARVLVVERSTKFLRRVGEATVEVSGCFLGRVLRLQDHLARAHLPKHGLRFWFTDRPDRKLTEMTEVGPGETPDLPSYQLDRSRLDEHLLATAAEEGVEVLRPAKVIDVETGWPSSRVRIAVGPKARAGRGEVREVRTRWVIDASGRQTFLGRRLGVIEKVDRHPTAALWARWKGVKDLDGIGVLGKDPTADRLATVVPSRRLATNHFCGYGWWCWVIPLAGGETSVGLVYDKRLFEPPGDGPLRQRYQDFVTRRAGLGELLEDAEIADDDFLALRHLPYRTTRYMDRGWALVGDAAAFVDPFYSPGLDHASISVFATARILADDLAGRLDPDALAERVRDHDRAFVDSYDRWLGALYEGKYELLGDAELTRCAYLLDTALYYVGVVTPVYEQIDALANPLFGVDNLPSRLAYRFMRFYARRLRHLARLRRLTGTYGRHNVGRSSFGPAFRVGRGAAGPFLGRGLKIWAGIEVEQAFAGLRARLRGKRLDPSRPVVAAG